MCLWMRMHYNYFKIMKWNKRKKNIVNLLLIVGSFKILLLQRSVNKWIKCLSCHFFCYITPFSPFIGFANGFNNCVNSRLIESCIHHWLIDWCLTFQHFYVISWRSVYIDEGSRSDLREPPTISSKTYYHIQLRL